MAAALAAIIGPLARAEEPAPESAPDEKQPPVRYVPPDGYYQASDEKKPPGYHYEEDVEKAAQQEENVLSGITNLQVQNTTNFLIGPFERAQNIMALRPTFPLRLASWLTLNLRPVIPLVWNPVLTEPTASAFGLGDIGLNVRFTNTFRELLFVSIGPAFRFPTGTDIRLGGSNSGKFSIGPELIVNVLPGHWVLGVSISNLWSVAGRESGTTVNAFSVEPSAIYNFPHGYYLTASFPISANWTADSGNRWVVPVGGGVGAVKLITKTVGVNLEVQAFGNVVATDPGALWTMRFQAAVFFPRLKGRSR